MLCLSKQVGYQDLLLNQVRKENVAVTVFLTNGFQIRGVVTGFDTYVILLDSDGKQQMIYKHAISTIVPIRPIKMAALVESNE